MQQRHLQSARRSVGMEGESMKSVTMQILKEVMDAVRIVKWSQVTSVKVEESIEEMSAIRYVEMVLILSTNAMMGT
jgi:hypothetical protein